MIANIKNQYLKRLLSPGASTAAVCALREPRRRADGPVRSARAARGRELDAGAALRRQRIEREAALHEIHNPTAELHLRKLLLLLRCVVDASLSACRGVHNLPSPQIMAGESRVDWRHAIDAFEGIEHCGRLRSLKCLFPAWLPAGVPALRDPYRRVRPRSLCLSLAAATHCFASAACPHLCPPPVPQPTGVGLAVHQGGRRTVSSRGADCIASMS